jgi:hypothetical protein
MVWVCMRVGVGGGGRSGICLQYNLSVICLKSNILKCKGQ